MQLVFDIHLKDDATFDTYEIGANQEAVVALKQHDQPLLLWGNTSVGLSHLLQATCRLASASMYLPMKDVKSFSIECLDGLENLEIVCFDDIDAIAGDEIWEEAMFHAYNRMKAENTIMVFSTHCTPQSIPFNLQDLHSRILWGMTYQIHELNDEAKAKWLKKMAKQRGFELKPDVISYILNHASRDMASLKKLLDEIDKQSLIEKHKVTIPFVKSVLS
ncbi:MAG: DnaA regulatory inactivator Hda [Gammaproteobacteria bacterium]